MNDLKLAQNAAFPHLSFAGCPDISDALDRGDWSEVSVRLRDAGYSAEWDRARAAILAACPGADA